MSIHRGLSRTAVSVSLVLTGLYWVWESRASGNIRVDLLLIYPALFFCYIFTLWPRFRYLSILMAACLMALNYGFALMSYSLFGKNPG